VIEPMRTLALTAALAFSTAPAVGEPDATRGPGDLAVHCGTLYVTPTRVVKDGWLVIRDGRVASISANAPTDQDLTVVDASDKTVIAGLVAADSDLSGHGDDTYNVTPDFVALDGFDFLREYNNALSGGVTTVYLAPGRNRLVPGQGSVVKLAGDDLVQRVLSEAAALRVTLGEPSTKAPPVFEPTIFPTADDPLEPAQRQFPSARISQLATLRELFAEAATAGENQAPTGPAPIEERYALEPLRQVQLGSLQLRIAARGAADVRRAIQFGKELNLVPVLENPADVDRIAPWLRDVPVVFRAPVRLSASNPGGGNRADKSPTDRPEHAGIAAKAGARVALAPGRTADLPDMLMLAAIAVRYGMEPGDALAAVTSTAAEVLGVADRVGTLEVGRDADFLVLSGPPLAVGTMVEQTWIDGRPAYERQSDVDLLAIRAPRILVGNGETIRDGTILIADGKVRGIGTDLAIPYGARVLEMDGVVTPGFVDGNTTLGLSGDGVEVPGGSADQKIAAVLDPADPTFVPAARAGVTTLFVSGVDQGLVSGRVAAVKSAAANVDSMVVRDIAGVRFVFDGIGPDAAKPLIAEIEKGKKYIEAWKAYEKALADFEAGKAAKPVEAKPEPEEDAKPDPITGTWDCEMEIPQMGRALSIKLMLKLDGTKVTGTAQLSFGERELPEAPIEDGSFQNGELKATLQFMRNQSAMVATVSDDSFEGTVQAMGQEAKITGRRTKAGAAAKKSSKSGSDDGRPKKPAVDEAMESMKALIEKRATAVIRVQRAPAIEAVAKALKEADIRFVLHGADDLVDTPNMLEAPHVMLGPNLVRREEGKIVNAPARLADAGATVSIVTGDNAGSRYIAEHAMHAIRYGMDPQAALHALTLGPAKMFGVDDRIGSLERGKDADLVVFSGSPFDPTSRVQLVVCNGRVVFDAREEND
jgi:imidazolonepropionase-like amidohydrolase